jgi:hypothetical protein
MVKGKNNKKKLQFCITVIYYKGNVSRVPSLKKEKEMKKPNLFEIATSELSQDSFITWLLQWADESNTDDPHLNETGKLFVSSLLKIAEVTDIPKIKKVKTRRQWKNIDITADVNEKYFIVIEDKKDAGEHGDQLNKYKKIVDEHYQNKREIVMIYLKTGNESLDLLDNIEKKGWVYYSRRNFLDILESSKSQNNILRDFTKYLQRIEENTNAFTNYVQLKNKKNRKASEGLYIFLQKKIDGKTHWEFVSNRNHGFLGFWYYFKGCKENPKRKLYLQIESYSNDIISLYIRINGDWNKKTEYLRKVFKVIKEESKNKNIEIEKPARFKTGESSSVAIVKNAFRENQNGNLDLDHLLKTMKQAELVIDEVVEQI